MPDLIVHSQPHEPPEEEIVVELLHQHPLAPDAVEHLQEQSSQESFGRDGRSAHLGVHLLEVGAQTFEGLVDHLPHLPERMIARNSGLQAHVAEQLVLFPVVSSHASTNTAEREIDSSEGAFSAAC